MHPADRGTSGRAVAALTAAALGTLVAPACGSGLPPLLGSDGPDASGRADASESGVPHLLVDSGPPSCKAGPEGGVCGCLDLPLMTDPPNLYFVLDHSGSMNEGNKWETVRGSIGRLMTEIGPRANFGAALFPDPKASQNACATGVEVSPLHRGDSPAGVQGVETHALLSATDIPAYGGTPTAATLVRLTPRLASFRGRTFAILATDGGPNCDTGISCTSASCTLNIDDNVPGCAPGGVDCCAPAKYGPESCLDSAATIAAVSGLAAKGVPTYVIGVPGSQPYASLLDELARAGGTARAKPPYYYPVDTTDQAAFYSALAAIAAKLTATCVLPLGMTPPDPGLVNVYLNGHVVPQAGPNGWSFSGNSVTLLGTSCSEVLDGQVLDVRVVAGCPTLQK